MDMAEDGVLQLVIRCANFAAIKHKDQKRKDPEGTPYINHPIGVAFLLVEAGVTDPSVIQAALLHDTVEDTETTNEELMGVFGGKVASIVAEVTDDKNLPKQERKQLQIVHAPTKSKEAKLVKLADKLYNLNDLERQTPIGWSEERVQEYFEWAAKVVKGCRGTNAHLEEQLDKLFKKRNVDV
ncbi:metazoan SpoT homolog-1 [Oratosquilla oratoria]|uniref:metazoan SpoT homolog-1 n=1 Tax=Oratosquilla oratoria TaxID=337810 RepID=UPI003F76CB1A